MSARWNEPEKALDALDTLLEESDAIPVRRGEDFVDWYADIVAQLRRVLAEHKGGGL